MKFLFNSACFLIAAAIALSASTASAQFFTDGLDDLSNWAVAQDADTTLTVVDYSADGIPEAPNMVAGSGATTGVKITANTDATAAAASANIIGATIGGNADLALTTYQVTFDAWMNTTDPLPGGSTEQIVFGVGRTTATALGRNNRGTAGDGTWGWLAVENGYGTEDSALFSGTVEQTDIGDTNDAGADVLFNNAFDTTVSDSANDAPANQWVSVTMTVDNGDVTFYYNDWEFLSATGLATTAGDIMLGYEDPFSSIGTAPASQFAIIDNVVIDDAITIVPNVPEPTSLVLLSLGGLAMLARRR